MSHNQTIKVMKSFQEWKEDQADSETTASAITLICLGVILLLSVLTSCTTSKVVYEHGNAWKPMSKTSQLTGWAYQNK
jgi:hypothetical protein